MLTQAYNVLHEQLTKNLAEQDFYKRICTEVSIKDKVVLQLQHPSAITEIRTAKEVFPERAQNDIDKEYEPLIALSFSFSMKNDKEQLEKFKARTDFGDFREIKDFGARMYAIDFGTDIDMATEKSIDIVKDVYEIDKAKRLKIITYDIESGEVYSKKSITLPVKVDGVAMRVVEEKKESTPPKKEMSEKGTLLEDLSEFMKWSIGTMVVLFLIGILIHTNRKHNQENNIYTNSENVIISEETPDESIEKTEQNKKEDAQPKTEIIGKWKELDNGGSYVWQLEKDKSTDQYKLIQIIQGQHFQELKCTYKKIKRSNEYKLHDVRDGSTFSLKVGTNYYFVPNFDDGSNAILIVEGNNAYLYSNDINRQVYDYFATLQSIN